MKTYKAEILSINEWRWYEAANLLTACQMAIEEFGEDDVGRVVEAR